VTHKITKSKFRDRTVGKGEFPPQVGHGERAESAQSTRRHFVPFFRAASCNGNDPSCN
jgi:hypothetical protein